MKLKDDLRIQAEEKARKEEEKKKEEEERKREIERLAQLQQFKVHHNPAPSVASMISNYDDHKNIDEEENEAESSQEEDSQDGDEEQEIEDEEEMKALTNEFNLPKSLTVVEKYNDGFNSYFLMEDRVDGNLKGYLVSEISQESLNPVFILPESFIHRSDNLKVEVQLSVSENL